MVSPPAWQKAVAGARASGFRRAVARAWPAAGRSVAGALEEEWAHRRFFLWLPAAAGTGVCLYFAADQEPARWLPLLLFVAATLAAVALRHRRAARVGAVGLAAVAAGFLLAEWRTARVGGPVLTRTRIVHLVGRVDEVDPRRQGSRFVLRVESSDELGPAERPARVRLTTRRDDPLAAGDRVAVTARLLPPATPALPGGYSFSRDAFFAGFGAVGSLLGRPHPPPAEAGPSPGWSERASWAIDRARNALAARVDALLGGGDTGAIAAAMVTGKRDRLSEDGREIIREAGIFHIITIAGVQMTLVAGLLFGITRRLLVLSPVLALRFSVKKAAALVAMAGAVGYDLLTGSRVGTERALVMTLVMLGAVLADRRGFTMRNLALAALAIMALQPEAILGASFQLSFAAVAALVAVYEARQRRRERDAAAGEVRALHHARGVLGWPARALEHGRALAVATVCATAATASFMAAGFHELSPYVLIGNPVTLAVIEFFAVPGALLGSFLYPLGLDAPVWHWIGLGIRLVMAVARLIGALPGATLTVPAFAPWALPFLTLAVLSAVLWRTMALRLTAVPLALVGLLGAASGPRYDLLVAADGSAVAVRGADGRLALAGRVNPVTATQWLRADGDSRDPAAARAGRCDPLACIVPLPEGQTLSLVADAFAFGEDCRRVDAVITGLRVPATCAAPLIVDRDTLAAGGALGFTLDHGGWVPHPTRVPLEDRPWSPAPRPFRVRATPVAEPPVAESPAAEPAPEATPSPDDTAPSDLR